MASCSTACAALATSGRSSRGKSMSPSSNRIMYLVIVDRLLSSRGCSLAQERPHLDLPVAGLRSLGGELERHIEGGCLDDPEAGKVLLGFQERSVGEHRLLSPIVDDGGRARCPEADGEDPVALGLEPLVEDVDGRRLGRGGQAGRIVDYGDQVLHGGSSPVGFSRGTAGARRAGRPGS